MISEDATIPDEIVVATFSEMKAPARLSTAESATATRGRSARVAIEVAIALAVSWNPFVKSKASAVTMTTTRSRVLPTLGCYPQWGYGVACITASSQVSWLAVSGVRQRC